MRVRGIIKDGFADPDLDPCEVAARAGISLRYLQKLFTQRGSTCSEFIYSFRLDTPRIFYSGSPPWAQVGRSGRLRMPSGFSRLQPFREKVSSAFWSRTRPHFAEKVATAQVHWTLAARKSSLAHHQAEHRHIWLIRQLALSGMLQDRYRFGFRGTT